VHRDGKYVPTFSNARYFMGKREVERWDYRLPGYNHIPENDGIFENSVLPILEAGLAEVIGDSHEVSPSLQAELAHGHTLGHMALHLCSAGRHGWFTGDAFHHPIELLHPELDQHSCEDYPATVATRKRLIEAFIAQSALIIPAHFTAPHAGYLREDSGRRRFEPLASAQA
jgi:glyoxylase-like metal-dependent hydrolase (beta-lactamase superfamily II)